jgi:hypothetical protein
VIGCTCDICGLKSNNMNGLRITMPQYTWSHSSIHLCESCTIRFWRRIHKHPEMNAYNILKDMTNMEWECDQKDN